MKKYQVKALKELENLIHNCKIHSLKDQDRSDFRESLKILEDMRKVIKKEYIIDGFMSTYAPYIPSTLKFMNLNDYEKMNLFFDLLEPLFIPISDDNRQKLSADFFINTQIMGLTINDFEKIWNASPSFDEVKKAIRKNYPDHATEIIIEFEKNLKEGELLKQKYILLRKLVYEEDRRPLKETLPQIQQILETIVINDECRQMLINELTKNAKLKSSKKEKIDYSTINLGLKVEYKPVLSDKEWKSLMDRINELYNIHSNLRNRSLDILEKIELVDLLKILSYQEKELKNILWEIDSIVEEEIISSSKNKMYNGIILNEIYKKSKESQKKTKIPENIAEIYFEIQQNCENAEEKNIWLELLMNEIDIENQNGMNILLDIHEKLKGISTDQKTFWKKTFLEEKDYQMHSAFPLIIIIRELLKISDDKQMWKKRLHETMKRLQLEQIGFYDYELSHKRLERKKR